MKPYQAKKFLEMFLGKNLVSNTANSPTYFDMH